MYAIVLAPIVGWLLFGPRPRFTWGTTWAAFIWPVGWLAYIFVQGAFTHWYPYPFLDVNKLGYVTALANVGKVLLLAVAAALAFKLVDNKLPALVRGTRGRT